jgi:uncharacterized protein YegL
MRKLPIYLVLDVSGSMRGEPIEAVRVGIHSLVQTLMRDPYALETAYLSVITFNNKVNLDVPLTEIIHFNMPEIEAKNGTYIGKALKFLEERIDLEVTKTTAEVKGDWKPLVFLMSDGRSGDSIEKALKSIETRKFGFVIVCAAGPDSNIEALKHISENVVLLKNLDKETIKSFFKWVSASVCASSVKIGESNQETRVISELPSLPSEITIV